MREKKSPEPDQSSEWAGLKAAFGVFPSDYGIVEHHPDPSVIPLIVSVFGEPNAPIEGHRQYTVTGIPEGMTQAEFDEAAGRAEQILVTCMDKDCSGELWRQVSQDGKVPTILISMGGGIVQPEGERTEAVRTVFSYLSNVTPHVKKVMATGHDDICGLVKYALDGTPLTEKLGCDPCSAYEDTEMKGFILNGATAFELAKLFSNAQVEMELACLDRSVGIVEYDTNFDDIEAKKIEDHIIS